MATAPASSLDAYRDEADRFIAALDEEYYLHYAGLKESFELEPIYDLLRSELGGLNIDPDQAIEVFLCDGFSKVVGYLPHHITLREGGNLSFRHKKIKLCRESGRLDIPVDVNRLPFLKNFAHPSLNEPCRFPGSLTRKHISDVTGDGIGLFLSIVTDQLVNGLNS